MNTKNILKTLALAMLLIPACNKNEIANDENADKKGFALPVTVNVTREGDDATKATYDDGTKKLSFSAGDKLFVSGSATGAGSFAGALDYVPATGKFSGTIYTQKGYDGTADALFSAASSVSAILLPNGYESYNFLYINNNNIDVLYDDVVRATISKAFVASETAKKTGVEQLSWEQAYTYSSGFALAPANAVLNFTISGLEAGEKAVTLITKYSGMDFDQTMSGSVTPNASGVATFAIGVPNNLVIKNVANNLTVGSTNFTLPGNTPLAAGKIYNITRSVPPAVGHALSASAVGEIVGTDGKAYAASGKNNLPTGVKAEAVVTYKSGSNGFALAIVDYPNKGDHDAASGTYLTQWRSAHPVSGCTWVLPTREQWENTYNGCAGTAPTAIYPDTGNEGNMGNLNTYLTGADGTAMNDNHWTNTANSTNAWVCTNSNSAANTCNFNSNGKNVNLFFRYGIAF